MIISLARPLPETLGRLSQRFGEHPEWYDEFGLAGHNGIDYAVAEGAAVLAAHAGVCSVGMDHSGYGLFVRIDGPDYRTLYAHLSAILVTDGQAVECGEQIGTSGNTGNSTGPHLHFGLRVKGMLNPAYGNYIDPVPFRDI